MASIPNYNRDSNFTSPFSRNLPNGNDPMRRNFGSVDSQSYLQKPAARWDENHEPSQKPYGEQNQFDYKTENNSRNVQASLWDSVGDNQRKKALLNDYQSYMKSNPLPPYAKQRQVQEYAQQPEERRLLARKQSSEPAGQGWYTQNAGIGILPGMDEKRSQDFRPLQDKYNHTPSGSRLAGIGSRLLDNPRTGLGEFSSVERQRGALDEVPGFRSPQFERDALRFNFATPQNAKGEGNPLQLGRYQSFSNSNDPYAFPERKNNEFGKKIESLKDLDNYQGAFKGFERDEPKPSFHVKPQLEFDFGRRMGGDIQEQRQQVGKEAGVKRNEEVANKGLDWISERQRQEEDKRLKQKDELQKIYRDQIEEKKRKKQEEQRRQLLEDQKEEERLRKENEELQRQYQLEEKKKKGGVEEPKNSYQPKLKEPVNNDYLVGGKRRIERQDTNPFEATGQSNFRREMERPAILDYYNKDKEQNEDPDVQRIDALIKEASSKFATNPVVTRPKYEFNPNQEVQLHKGISQYNSTLDDQLEKMKRDIEQHAHLIKNELSTYKRQAKDSLELRHHAQNELLQLREELKAQQLQAENNTSEEFGLTGEKNTGFKLGQVRSQDQVGLRIPNKNYSKIYCPEEEGQDLGAAPSMTLDVETQYVSAKGNQKYKELPKVEDMLHKYGSERGNATGVTSSSNKDAAMEKFGLLFPSHSNKGQESNMEDNRGYGNQGRLEYEDDSTTVHRRRNDYEARQGEGMNPYVSTTNVRNMNNRFRDDGDEDVELPASQELLETPQ